MSMKDFSVHLKCSVSLVPFPACFFGINYSSSCTRNKFTAQYFKSCSVQFIANSRYDYLPFEHRIHVEAITQYSLYVQTLKTNLQILLFTCHETDTARGKSLSWNVLNY